MKAASYCLSIRNVDLHSHVCDGDGGGVGGGGNVKGMSGFFYHSCNWKDFNPVICDAVQVN